ncbi:calpain-9 [Protopterus annectens]|uniref:calpain-9 n=1 Tax=Protopterus annectens TaxID=7888 RepID=UPI001CFA63C2|nr:calpain-9 [Protopterus annectens]
MPQVFHVPSKDAISEPVDAICTQLDGRTYHQIRNDCLRNGILFEDPDFPANDSSLYHSEKPALPFVWRRPKEICKNPEFLVDGASRTDICQGDLGDCWLLAAIASLTLNSNMMARVVPMDQDFGAQYAGVFHFQFWQHNQWLDVVIDDRLPTFKNRLVFVHSPENNEFWSALFEKAYAKLNGTYEALKGGSTLEAMEDFTGGVGEMYETKKAPDNLFKIIQKGLHRGSMMGCSIDISSSAETEAKTPYGLVKGHAYSVTGLEEVPYQGRNVQLIRVRNPWGQVEWNGAWSDNAPEWQRIDPSVAKRLSQRSLDDGEFWMSFEDFKKHFDKLEICNLTPDALDDDTLHKWEMMLHEGKWVKGATAGGCRNFIDTFWTNPQFKIHLTDKDDDKSGCTVIIALMQKNRRKLRKVGAELLTVGFAIYECPPKDEQLPKDFFRYNASKARSKTFINVREISERFKLPPGHYAIIPSSFEPGHEADFCLRVFSEKKATSQEMDGKIIADIPEPPKPNPPQQETEEEKQFRYMFERIAGEDMEISPGELQYVLNNILRKQKDIQFKDLSIWSCKSIVSLMDTDGTGKLGFSEFKIFWEKLKKWKTIFMTFDTDRSGAMSSYELRPALKAAGFQLNNKILQMVVLRYADDRYEIQFDDFLCLMVRLETSFRAFSKLQTRGESEVDISFPMFIGLILNI